MDEYIRMFSGWTRDGVPAYPTWSERMYFFLRNESETALLERFRGWRFTEREIGSLLSHRDAATQSSLADFEALFRQSIAATPDDYPPVLRPRNGSSAGETARKTNYAALLRGKRVALLGPANSVVGSKAGALIESYDLVARLNFQWPIQADLRADIGERMDILYHCCNGDLEIESLFRSGLAGTVKFVCWQFNVDSWKLAQYCEDAGVPSLDVESVYEELLDATGTFPNTGTVAISNLLQYEIDELYIHGISFYQDPYHPNYRATGIAEYEAYRSGRSSQIRMHQVAPQLEWFKRLCTHEPRLRLDDRLAEITNNSLS